MIELNRDYIQAISLLIHSPKSADVIKEELLTYHPFEIAEVVSVMSDEEISRLVQILSPEEMGDIISHLDFNALDDVFSLLPQDYASKVLETMEVDDAADILDVLKDKNRYLNLIRKERRAELIKILNYNQDSVGSIMNTNFLEISADADAKSATKYVMDHAKNVEHIFDLYVTKNDALVGELSLKKLIVARAQEKITDIMTENPVSVPVNTNKEDAADIIRHYDLTSLPVVGDNHDMLGIITFDDVMDVIDQAATEDYVKMAGVIAKDISHENDTIWSTFKVRVPWLIILLLTDLLLPVITGGFENTLAALPVLAIFLPLLLGLSGNAGTQSLAITLRLISLKQVDTRKEKWQLFIRELWVGLINGILIALIMFAASNVMLYFNSGGFSLEVLKISLIVSVSVIFIMVFSTVDGVLFPLLMVLLHIDPAAASGPFITTINDIAALLTYFALATMFIIQSL